MDSTTFDSEEDEGAEEGEWSTAQPRVWTFQYHFSVKYLQAALSRCGLEYSFESPRPKEVPRQTFLKELKFEQYSNRIRIHKWAALEDGKSGLPDTYYWFDIRYNLVDHRLWDYDFTHSVGKRPAGSMYVSLVWNNKDKVGSGYRSIKWALRYSREHEIEYTEETLFEVPLDVNRLGNTWGGDEVDVSQKGDRQIYCTEDTFAPFEQKWQCASRQGPEWEWEWWLCLQTFDASGTVIRGR
jgi:hypothetical protein